MVERRQTDKARLESLLRISQYNATSTQDLLDFALSEAISLTQSAFGYIYFYNDTTRQFTLNSWSKGVMEVCTIMDPQTVYDLDNTGVWGEAVRQGCPIVLNDFATPNPLKKGYPEGHAPLHRFMTIPVFHTSRIVAVLGLANKKEAYTEVDLQQVTLLMNSVWQNAERKRVEDELAQSQQMLHQIINTLPERIFWKDTQLRYLGCNRLFAKEAGLTTADEIVGKTDGELSWSTMASHYEAHDKKILSTGQPHIGYLEELDSPDGNSAWLRRHKVPLKTKEGKIIGILGTYEDITDVKRDQLRRERLAAIVEASYDAIIGTTRDGTISGWNRGAEKIYGFGKYEILGRSISILSPPEKEDQLVRIIGDLGDSKHIEFYETVHKRKNGEYFDISLSVSRIFDDQGRMAGLSIIGRDITEKKKSESELRRYRDFIENVTDGCVEVDLNGRITFANKAVGTVMGYPIEELLGMDNRRYASPEESKKIFKIFNRVYQTGQPDVINDFTIVDKQGRKRIIELTVSLIHDTKAEPTGFRGTTRDITNKRKAETALRESEERTRLLFNNIPVPTFVWKISGDKFILSEFNSAALNLVGDRLFKATGKTADGILEDIPQIQTDIRKCIDLKHTVDNQFWYKFKNRPERRYFIVKYAWAPPDQVLMHVTDITGQKLAEEELQYISIHDSLTGLYNRFYADAEVERLTASRLRPVSIVVIDLNNLKTVNDQRGHAQGDRYIKDATTILKQTFRPEDMIARIGGDEFLILLPQVDATVCNHILERLYENIARFNQRSDQEVYLSAGSATAQPGDNLIERIREADQRMYEDKARFKAKQALKKNLA